MDPNFRLFYYKVGLLTNISLEYGIWGEDSLYRLYMIILIK